MRSLIRGFLTAGMLLAAAAGAACADPADPSALDRSDPTSVARAYVRAIKAADYPFARGLIDPQWRTVGVPEPANDKEAVTRFWGGLGVAECFRATSNKNLTVSRDEESAGASVIFGIRSNPAGLPEDPCILMLSLQDGQWYVHRVMSVPAAFIGNFEK